MAATSPALPPSDQPIQVNELNPRLLMSPTVGEQDFESCPSANVDITRNRHWLSSLEKIAPQEVRNHRIRWTSM